MRRLCRSWRIRQRQALLREILLLKSPWYKGAMTAADYLNQSMTLNHAGKFRGEYCSRAQPRSHLDPGMAAAWNNIAANHASLHHWDQAIDADHKAIALDPNLQLAKNNLAWARLAEEDRGPLTRCRGRVCYRGGRKHALWQRPALGRGQGAHGYRSVSCWRSSPAAQHSASTTSHPGLARTPDERTYTRQADIVLVHGAEGFRALGRELTANLPEVSLYPSPLRVGYISLLAAWMRLTGDRRRSGRRPPLLALQPDLAGPDCGGGLAFSVAYSGRCCSALLRRLSL